MVQDSAIYSGCDRHQSIAGAEKTEETRGLSWSDEQVLGNGLIENGMGKGQPGRGTGPFKNGDRIQQSGLIGNFEFNPADKGTHALFPGGQDHGMGILDLGRKGSIIGKPTVQPAADLTKDHLPADQLSITFIDGSSSNLLKNLPTSCGSGLLACCVISPGYTCRASTIWVGKLFMG